MLAEQAENHNAFYALTLKLEKKGPKITHHIVELVKLLSVFHKDPFWILFYLLYTCATFNMKAEAGIMPLEEDHILKTLENEANELFDQSQIIYL